MIKRYNKKVEAKQRERERTEEKWQYSKGDPCDDLRFNQVLYWHDNMLILIVLPLININKVRVMLIVC